MYIDLPKSIIYEKVLFTSDEFKLKFPNLSQAELDHFNFQNWAVDMYVDRKNLVNKVPFFLQIQLKKMVKKW